MDLGSINKGLETGSRIFYLIWILLVLFFRFKKPKYLKKIIITGIVLFSILSFFILISQSFFTYSSWKQGPISKYLIPPYASVSYFFRYCFTNYYSNYLLTIGGAFLFGVLFWIFKKKNRIDSSEMLLAVLGSLFSGWPNLIIFLGITLALAIFYSLIQNYIKREKKRIFLFFPIIIASLITILFGNLIVKCLGISVLRM